MRDEPSPLWSRPAAPELGPPPEAGPTLDPTPDQGRVPPDLRHWWAGFAGVLLGYVLASVGGLFVVLFTGEVEGPTFALAATYVQDAAFFGVAYGFARFGSAAAPLVALGFRRPASPWRTVGVSLLIVLGFLVFNLSYGALVQVDDATSQTADTLGLDAGGIRLVFAAILLTIVAPLVEEALFRGLLFGALWRWRGWLFGAVIGGIVFGGIHAGGAPALALPVLGALGFTLCLSYWLTGSLLPAIGLHALNNAISLAAIVDWGVAGSVGLVAGAVTISVGIGWAISAPARSVLPAP